MQLHVHARVTRLNPDRLFGQVAHRLAVAIITGASPTGALLPNEDDLKGDEKREAKENNEAAHMWISGLEAVKRKLGIE